MQLRFNLPTRSFQCYRQHKNMNDLYIQSDLQIFNNSFNIKLLERLNSGYQKVETCYCYLASKFATVLPRIKTTVCRFGLPVDLPAVLPIPANLNRNRSNFANFADILRHASLIRVYTVANKSWKLLLKNSTVSSRTVIETSLYMFSSWKLFCFAFCFGEAQNFSHPYNTLKTVMIHSFLIHHLNLTESHILSLQNFSKSAFPRLSSFPQISPPTNSIKLFFRSQWKNSTNFLTFIYILV
jgi:hypothetical protein